MNRRVDPVRRSAPAPAAPGAAPARDHVPARTDRAGTLLALQRRHGNRQVGRWVAARRVGAPGDRAEHEAQRVARAVTGTAPAGAHRHDVASGPVPPAVTAGIAAARGRGAPLPADVRAPMEGALGADLGAVRLHTGAAADGLSRALSARAFTTGNDVFFRAGEHRPDTAGGRGVLAHELTHVVAQPAGDATIHRLPAPTMLGQAEPKESAYSAWHSGRFHPVTGDPDAGVTGKMRAGAVEAIVLASQNATTGSRPDKTTMLGWDWIHEFNGTGRGNGGWMRFHLLNENLDGPGDTKLNLVPTRQSTNQDSRWKTHFDERAKAAHAAGQHLHFLAEVRYHPQVANPQLPGERVQHFFPTRIEGQYRRWTGTAWQLLAAALLTPIARPPTTGAVVPITLSEASLETLVTDYRLPDDFAGILVGLRASFRMMGPATTLQRVYDLVYSSAEINRSRSRTYKGMPTALRRTIDTVWWPRLEQLLRNPLPPRPLSVNDDVDLTDAEPATTTSAVQRNHDVLSKEAQTAALELERTRRRAASAEERRKRAQQLANLLADVPDPVPAPTGRRL